MSYCYPCDRTFPTPRSLDQHLRTSSYHEWCDRCTKSFNSATARRRHLASSKNHHICLDCSNLPDYLSENDLDEHRASTHYHCTACDEYLGTAAQLTRHDVAVHNMCETCRSYFNSPQNLKAHGLTHKPKTVECYGCYNKFVSPSAMLLHLESGKCECKITCDEIVDLAYECHQSQHYTSDDDDCLFRCPTCDGEFYSISSLFQHVESDYCEEVATPRSPLGRFLRFLKSRM